MPVLIIIALCILLLVAYLFDLSASRTKIPSVIMLLALGWFSRQATTYLRIDIPDFQDILPAIGTIGLILIVLEGALEVELNRSKIRLIRKSFLGALFSIFFLGFALAAAFFAFGSPFRDSLTNAIPLCIISSAVIIPSVRYLPARFKEFVVYESSFSDIIGVMFFNFIVLNTYFDIITFRQFFFQILFMIMLSFAATIGLAALLRKIEHHVKFIPIIILIILIYLISEELHLPALIFILIFGLFIGNLVELKHFPWIMRFYPEELDREVGKFKEITNEATFLVRALFFLIFGFLIETREILNQETLFWAIPIVMLIYLFRIIQLKLSRLPLRPLLFMAPRGLITILLFLSIAPDQRIIQVNQSLVIQIVLLTAVVMTVGLMTSRRDEKSLMDSVQQVVTAVGPEDDAIPEETKTPDA